MLTVRIRFIDCPNLPFVILYFVHAPLHRLSTLGAHLHLVLAFDTISRTTHLEQCSSFQPETWYSSSLSILFDRVIWVISIELSITINMPSTKYPLPTPFADIISFPITISFCKILSGNLASAFFWPSQRLNISTHLPNIVSKPLNSGLTTSTCSMVS